MPTSPLPSTESLFEDAACGLVTTNAKGLILRANRTFCGWLGYAAEELVDRRRLQDLLTMGGRIFHQTHWAPLLQMQGSVAEVKLDVVPREGAPIPMVMNVVRRAREGGVFDELAMFVAVDRHKYETELLQARRRAEESLANERAVQRALALALRRLNLARDAAQLFVWDVDPATGRRRYDDSVAKLLGHAQARPVGAEEFAQHIVAADRAAEADAFARAMDPAQAAYACDFRLEGVDGLVRTVSATGQASFDAGGALVEFVGMLQDVSELSRQRAVAEDRALVAEQMIGIVSHDLRNPLSAILLGATVLDRTELTPVQARTVERILNSTARANRLIADLLDFTQARLRRGLKVAPREVELHALVAECVEELALAFPGRDIRHAAQGSGGASVDADRLVQLIGNLVANAIAYGAPDRPVLVRSSIEPHEFSVSVHNEGPPIPAALLPHLFEPMTRGANATDVTRSVGLGLFIVREIVRAHGGEVAVESSAEAGTAFFAVFARP